MMKQLVHILLLLSLCYLPACKEKAPKPGTERFYCQVNGKAFRPHSGGDFFSNPIYFRWYPKGYISFRASNYKNDDDRDILFGIKLPNEKIEERVYSLQDSLLVVSYYGPIIKVDGESKDHGYDATEGMLTITRYDEQGRSVSGTFEFRAKSRYTDETVEVTKGQFNDVHVYGRFN